MRTALEFDDAEERAAREAPREDRADPQLSLEIVTHAGFPVTDRLPECSA